MGVANSCLWFGEALNICGWFISFISQCYAQNHGHLSVVFGRTVWFTTFLELFLCCAVFLIMFMGTPIVLMTSIMFGIGTLLSVLHTDFGIYADHGDLEALGAGYLILAIGNLLCLIYFAIKYEMDHMACTGVQSSSMGRNNMMYTDNTMSGKANASGMDGIIGTFSGSGLRNRNGGGNTFSGPDNSKMSENRAMDTIGDNNMYSSEAGLRSPNLGTPSALGADPLSGGYSQQPEDVSINMASNGSAARAGGNHGEPADASAATAAPASQSTTFASMVPNGGGVNGSNLAPPITTSNFGSAGVGAGAVGVDGSVPASSAPLETGMGSVQRAEALYSYKASEDDPTEISFTKGDILQIVDSSGKWWQAQRPNGELGIVPSNYLRLI